MDTALPPAPSHASIVVARDVTGHVAILSAEFPQHGGEYLFLPGGRQEPGEDAEQCARRELREEAGITAEIMRPLGSFAITPESLACVSLFTAENLTLGPQQLTPTEEDFKLTWWPLDAAITAATEGRFLLPSGPLALFLTQRLVAR